MQQRVLAEQGPVVQEIVYREPLALALRLRRERHLSLFESVLRHEHLGRYSFLACNPSLTLTASGGQCFLDDKPQNEPPLVLLDRLLAAQRMAHAPGLPPFQGGFAGYIGYEFGHSLEPGALDPGPGRLCPDLMLHRYDAAIGFDHLQERAWIMATNAAAAEDLESRLGQEPASLGSHVVTGWQSNFTRAAYEEAVARTIGYILAGDIFQANIAQCFSAAVSAGFDPLAFYRRLRAFNPAPFAAYLDYSSVQIASSSPERLFSFDGQTIEARPIKGTRRRDADPARDAALVAELSSSRKDRAENVMIVDLLRNDLSRVARPGSVRVPILCGLETYASVHHLTSVITGTLQQGNTLGDVIAAAFPGGSITGAPKIRAMQIIAEIEQAPRGVYCGSIGWFSFNGRADLNIAIRTAQFAGGRAYVSGGSGITARSNPAAEFDETLAKTGRIMEAFAP